MTVTFTDPDGDVTTAIFQVPEITVSGTVGAGASSASFEFACPSGQWIATVVIRDATGLEAQEGTFIGC